MNVTLFDVVESGDRVLTLGRVVAEGDDSPADPAVMAANWAQAGWPTEVDPEAKARAVLPEGMDPATVTFLRTRPDASLPWTYVAVVLEE
jgi:hypothetical protein